MMAESGKKKKEFSDSIFHAVPRVKNTKSFDQEKEIYIGK